MASGEGERRRRRRGRRGGRRNRRGREGESFAPETAPEPELAHAVARSRPACCGCGRAARSPDRRERTAGRADRRAARRGAGRRPSRGRRRRHRRRSPTPAAPEPTAAEPPRRRSTVREPAPQALRDEASAPAPSFTPPVPPIEPVVSSPAESERQRSSAPLRLVEQACARQELTARLSQFAVAPVGAARPRRLALA